MGKKLFFLCIILTLVAGIAVLWFARTKYVPYDESAPFDDLWRTKVPHSEEIKLKPLPEPEGKG